MCILPAMDLDALVDAYRQGQPAARRQLPVELYRLILPIFRRRFADVDVEDLTHDTIAAVFHDLDNFEDRGRGSFRAWVLKIAQNRRLGHAARQSRTLRYVGPLPVDVPDTRDANPRHLAHWRERLALLQDALTLVDPVYREAMLHLGQGGKAEELAERDGVKPQTIYSRAHRGRRAADDEVRARRKTTGRLIESPS